MKKKNYEVRIVAIATVLVIKAKDESEALELACDEVSYGDFEMLEADVRREIKTPQELESVRRHANAVSEPTP